MLVKKDTPFMRHMERRSFSYLVGADMPQLHNILPKKEKNEGFPCSLLLEITFPFPFPKYEYFPTSIITPF